MNELERFLRQKALSPYRLVPGIALEQKLLLYTGAAAFGEKERKLFCNLLMYFWHNWPLLVATPSL